MATTDEVITRLRESRPPATDAFTYLTIVEKSLSPAVLPTLHDILTEDVVLTRDIGWDLVGTLVAIPGSEKCLEAVARLGNPREVILKVQETLVKITEPVAAAIVAERDGDGDDDDADDDAEQETTENGNDQNGDDQNGDDETASGAVDVDPAEAARQFVTLVSMLAILHKRLVVKYPSRFLHSTLQTVSRAYPIHARSSPDATSAVIQLARCLSGLKRPPLPTRKSSLHNSLSSFPDPSTIETATDPEAEVEASTNGGAEGNAPGTAAGDKSPRVDEKEELLVKGLLRAFVTCVVEGFVNACPVEWASRLLEYYRPERIVPGKRTMMAAFKEEEELHLRDAMMGELAAIAADLGLSQAGPETVKDVRDSPIVKDPFAGDLEHDDPSLIKLSSGGFWCLTAYWLFASEVFDAQYSNPDMDIFPDHSALLERYLKGDPQGPIAACPGILEALLVIGLWLHGNDKILQEGAKANFMAYHHLVTLISVFHPALSVRNAATVFSGTILHEDPDEQDRLKILEDLLENCMFSTLQACAVTWLREEFVEAAKRQASSTSAPDSKASRFATPEALETLQYVLFPDVSSLADADAATMLEYWQQNSPLLLQTANVGVFLLGPESSFRDRVVPAGMAATVESRYVEPLLKGAAVLSSAIEDGRVEGVAPHTRMEVEVFINRLKSLVL